MNTKAIHHAYHKVGVNSKDVSRVWMQGEHLAASGFTKGTPYETAYNVDTRTIILTAIDTPTDTSRNVSGRKKKDLDLVTPIIELANASVFTVTQGASSIRADFYVGEIHISIHHHDIKQAAREERLKDHLSKGYVTKGVVCAGIGVSAAASHDGLAAYGIESHTKFIVDREYKYLDIARQNNHAITDETTIFEASLEELEPHLLGYVDEIHFSLGCTGHSKAGKAKNGNKHAEEHSTDATGVLGLMRIIDACQPSVLYSEQVAMAKGSATYTLLIQMLNVMGYTVDEIELCGEDTGSLESRPRWWFVATSNGLAKADLKNNFPMFEKSVHQLSDILEDVPADSDMWKSTAKKKEKEAINKAKGNSFKFNLVDGSATKLGVMGRHYSKDRATEAHLMGDTDKIARLLTTTEIAKSQSVPLHLIKNTVKTICYQALGQGIDYRQGMGVSVATAISVYAPLMAA